MIFNLSTLTTKYNRGIELTTVGDFAKALDAFRSCLQTVPVTLVRGEQEARELQDLVKRTTEYVSAMRIELERKRLAASGSTDNIRMTELCCYMTLCAMDLGHKFLAYKNAMNNNYKMNNFITAANFARMILEMEPTGVSLKFK